MQNRVAALKRSYETALKKEELNERHQALVQFGVQNKVQAKEQRKAISVKRDTVLMDRKVRADSTRRERKNSRQNSA